MKYWFVIFIVGITAFCYGQDNPSQLEIVDFTHILAVVEPDLDDKTITGKVTVSFTMKGDAPSVFIDAKAMDVYLREGDVRLEALEDRILIHGDFKNQLTYTVVFNYSAIPKQTLYFVNDRGQSQVWTQGQGKYTSHWLPSIDDMNDKIEFDLAIVAPPDHTVIANGLFQEKRTQEEGVVWVFDMQQPMSSYLVAFASGAFEAKEGTSASGVPLALYYHPDDAHKAEATYRYTQQIFDFLEEAIGVPYPWQNYKQIPVKDFLYAGMENTGTTIFSDSFVVDDTGFFDRNYVNVNAHELAHQWFGNLVTETDSEHHWLHEGFASYYALLAERDIFGEDYFYYKLYESAEQLKELSDRGKGQRLVNPKASSLTYYQKGAWALHILKEEVGDVAFAKAVKAYLSKHQYSNVTTTDFMTEVELAYGKELSRFKKDWLYQGAFQDAQALESLQKSDFMQRYFELVALRNTPLAAKVKKLRRQFTIGNDYLGQEAVYQLSGTSLNEALPLYFSAFDSQNSATRQAIAITLETVPKALLPLFTTLLDDESYVTQEQALLKLWLTYAQTQGDEAVRAKHEVLDKMEEIFGFSDGNVRTLWLALALASSGYRESKKQSFYDELKGYTQPKYPFQLRQNAFQYLFQVQLYDQDSLRNLVEACVHHNWRFRQSSRNLLNELLKNEDLKTTVDGLSDVLSTKERAYLTRIIGE